jgi:hypothetical protein
MTKMLRIHQPIYDGGEYPAYQSESITNLSASFPELVTACPLEKAAYPSSFLKELGAGTT